MSIECGECERDLRGGHDLSCSRYRLVDGVAYALARSIGHVVDEECALSEQIKKAAQAAVDHVRAYDEAQKPGIVPSPASGEPSVYTDAEKEALLALAHHKMSGGLDFTSSHAKIILDLLERFTRQYFPPLDVQCCMYGKHGMSIAEGDGGPECQMNDGRWTCSSDCYYRAVAILDALAAPASSGETGEVWYRKADWLLGRLRHETRAPKEQTVAWTNLHHLRSFLDGSNVSLPVIRKREPAWNMALYLSPDDLQFVPRELFGDRK